MKFKPTLRSLYLSVIAFALASSANAAVIFFDDFSTGTSGALNGQALVSPDTTTWTAGAAWTKNTTNDLVSASGGASAMVPMISFSAGDIIQVSARVINNQASSSTSWIAMGFSNGSIGTNGSGGRNWMLWRGNDQLRAATGNASLIGPTDVFAEGESNTLDLRMIFDFDAGSMTWLFKDPSSSVWTTLHTQSTSLSAVADMTHVGFASNAGSMSVEYFEVLNIPEPTTALLGGLGFLMLLRRRR
jgi:hypothetical protein